MPSETDKFPKEPAEGDRDVINHELERQQKDQAADEPPRRNRQGVGVILDLEPSKSPRKDDGRQ